MYASARHGVLQLQRQPSVRQAALEQLPTPMPFTTRSFRACASGSRTANNGVHQLSLRVRKIMKIPMTRARAYMSQNTRLLHLILPQGGRQVLGQVLNRSESRWAAA